MISHSLEILWWLILLFNLLINKFICCVTWVISKIYTGIIWIFEFLFEISKVLDGDIRRDVFIGVTGIFVAIIIFIAEFISNQKYELNKRLLLNKTKIIKNTIFIISIFAFMLFCSLFTLPINESILLSTKIKYTVLQTILNIMIIVSMIKTVEIFIIAVKINADSKYFNNMLEEYIYDRIKKIETEEINKFHKQSKKASELFDKYISSSKIISSEINDLIFEDEYDPIYPLKDGYIKDIDYNYIKSLIDIYKSKITNGDLENKLLDSKPLVIFISKIGDKVERQFSVAYCHRSCKSVFKDINKSIVLDESYLYLNDELRIIHDDLFSMARETISKYDNNNRMINYLNYLYENKYNGTKKTFLSKIEDEYIEISKEEKINEQFANFLTRIANISYRYNNFEDYCFTNRYITGIYYCKIQKENIEMKKVAYEYANHVFIGQFYSAKRNKDYRFYDNLMSNLLSVICEFIKRERFDAVCVLFDNILFNSENYWEELNKYDIVKFQFSCGIIYYLKIFFDKLKEELDDEQTKSIRKIINILNNKFNGFYDSWKLIYNFKKYFNMKSCIKDRYEQFDTELSRNEYVNHWSGYGINEREILKEVLYVFNTDYGDIAEADEQLIDRNDKYYYEDLLKLIQAGFNSKLDILLSNKFNVTELKEILNKAIKIAETKEIEYSKTEQLDATKIEQFKDILIDTANKKNKLIEYIYAENKFEQSEKKLKRVLGLNQLIPRDVFFKEYGGFEAIAKSFGEAISKGIQDEYIKNIESFSTIVDKDIEELLEHTENIENYVIFTDYITYSKINRANKNRLSNDFDTQNIDIIRVAGLEGSILIEKKYLPKIQYCQFDETYDKKNIENNIYYELNDCSVDETLRNDIIEHSQWLEEKGDKVEIVEYLKQQCRLRVYSSFRIVKIKNSMAIRINKKEE